MLFFAAQERWAKKNRIILTMKLHGWQAKVFSISPRTIFFCLKSRCKLQLVKREKTHNIKMISFPVCQQNQYSISICEKVKISTLLLRKMQCCFSPHKRGERRKIESLWLWSYMVDKLNSFRYSQAQPENDLSVRFFCWGRCNASSRKENQKS